MAFWIKVLLLAGLSWAANEVTRSEAFLNAYYGLYGTPAEIQSYTTDLALRQLATAGAEPRQIAFAHHSD